MVDDRVGWSGRLRPTDGVAEGGRGQRGGRRPRGDGKGRENGKERRWEAERSEERTRRDGGERGVDR